MTAPASMTVPASMFEERRKRFLESMGPGVAVFPAAPVFIRNNDVEHEYRQDSDFFYLCGFAEPESVLVLTNQHKEHRSVLFVRRRDPDREIWDGPRAGVEGALKSFGVDAAFPIDELETRLPEYLTDAKRLHYRLAEQPAFDQVIFRAMAAIRSKKRSGVVPPSEFVDPAAVVHEMRLRKSPAEVDAMKRAAAITRDAHVRAMQVTRPGAFEHEVEAEILATFRRGGSERAAYGSIVGSGPNATILHYRANNRRMQAGELLLIDAGCELDYYASDVTRTFPVSGKFSEPQRALYEVVLESQLAAIEAVKPGATIDGIHAVATRVLAAGMLKHGLITGDLETVLKEETYKAFYMHRTSHWLGMDVHDVGDYFAASPTGRTARPLEAGMVITVEPGFYVGENAKADAQWRGIGIRIEDDILVTANGYENLTHDIPKTVAEIEAVIRR